LAVGTRTEQTQRDFRLSRQERRTIKEAKWWRLDFARGMWSTVFCERVFFQDTDFQRVGLQLVNREKRNESLQILRSE
jgi:hypothetical protein